ncbi:DUF1493 family protein [Erwinia sp. CGal63]
MRTDHNQPEELTAQMLTDSAEAGQWLYS